MEQVQTLQKKMLLFDLSQKESKYKFCQSWGKTYSSVILNGHYENGDINPAFCNNCYDNGKFVEPELTFDELINRTDSGFCAKKSKFQKFQLRDRLNGLERWKKDQYT